MSYSEGYISAAYHAENAAVDTAGTYLNFTGPPGKTGRLVDVSVGVTVDVTVAAANLTIGSIADPNSHADVVIPISSAGATGRTLTRGVDDIIPADTLIKVIGDGGATAGDASITVHVVWY